jgi:hypothetical protein
VIHREGAVPLPQGEVYPSDNGVNGANAIAIELVVKYARQRNAIKGMKPGDDKSAVKG